MGGSNPMPNNYTKPFGCYYRDEEDMTHREELNHAKRGEMHRLVTALVDRGWTVAQLAAYCGVVPGAVRTWKSAKSMGNNEQRAQLVEMLAAHERAPGFWVKLVADRIKELNAVIADETAKAKGAGIASELHRYASDRMNRAQSWRDTLAERIK